MAALFGGLICSARRQQHYFKYVNYQATIVMYIWLPLGSMQMEYMFNAESPDKLCHVDIVILRIRSARI